MKYFAIIDGEQKGPFELEELADAGVRPSTYVWCKGMRDWEKAEDVADICRMFRNRIHDLMHPKSVEALRADSATSETDGKGSSTDSPTPSRYDRILEQSQMQLPSLEEIDRMEDTSHPPTPMLAWAIFATILFFPPTGIAAICFAVKSSRQWKMGNAKEAYDLARSAKMWTGITFFLGLILYAALARLL